MAAPNISEEEIESVLTVYESMLDSELNTNWLLLKYGGENDEFFLHASGARGLPELKQAFEDLSAVHIAFYHEEVPSKPGYVLINYIPPQMSGVRRARALVQSRRVGALFIKASSHSEHSTLTIDHLSNLTPSSVHQAVLKPDEVHNIRIERSTSSPDPTITNFDPSTTSDPMIHLHSVRRSFTETYNPKVVPPDYSSSPHKSQSLFSSILRRSRNKTEDVPWESDDDAISPPPPPTPPKVPPKDQGQSQIHSPPLRSRAVTNPEFRSSLAEFAFISHPIQSSDDEVLVEHPNSPAKTSIDKPNGALFSIPIDRKWVQDAVSIPDPEERARRRQIAQQQRAREERRAQAEEAERQARIKQEREEMKRQEEEEEEWRKAMLEQELQEITAQRRAVEQREKEEDERKTQEIEMRKEQDRQRRIQEHEKLEKWRQQLAREAEAEKRKEADDKRKMDAERKTKVQDMVKEVKGEMKSSGSTTAWATIQTSDSLVWRRRYIKLVGSKFFLYRSPKDMNQVLDEVELRGQIGGLREPDEGFEELKAIKYSFAIVFKDGRDPWSVFGDTEEEKIKMLGMLHYAAGL
ncbi:hypothetical protein BDP27DRAFT_1253044 [Rhodocollybia butyracea]|uniref:ADF-H domain-containing protein n=1 Tax=Rhodocollybia butyracea TaxID=206335 RepID=A0A9P5UG71_9AGAR|nr:hypothetical protein BDP27DRAFT_1253044 [Rhodocollybia butyracea]